MPRSGTPFHHRSVMCDEILAQFGDLLGKTIADVTAGGGGHLRALLKAVGPNGRIVALDRDKRAHELDAAGGVSKENPSQIKLFHRPFSRLKETLLECGINEVDGIVADLGVSSHQLDEASRGFSFMANGPIDMRMDQSAGMSAYDWLVRSSEREIADTLFNLGGERKSRAIAALIKKSMPIENSTAVLAKLICSAMRQKKWSRIHPATRSFQAIRMAVNHEYDELVHLLKDLPELLAPGGVAVFLSFHSIEDGLIKRRFRQMAKGEVQEVVHQFSLLAKKPQGASEEELSLNPRSRSAKLRAIKRII